ncbi:MAG: oxidoreductase [Herpetosiphonaceae bacterium]|nr:MAG: oxidoreductase [Herpetosiphonaceae bacterium]
MADMIGVAFVGCTHPHIFPRYEILNVQPGVRCVGCYDPDESLAAALEQRFGLMAFASVEELLDQPGVNFVIVEGWDTANPGYVRQALQRNQAVLLEKPGAPNLDEMRSLMDDVHKAAVPFQVGYMMRFSRTIQQARRILAEGVLGPITLGRFHAAAPVGRARELWQNIPGNTGGVVYTDGCHMIDLIIHLLGMPKRVKGMTLTLSEGEMVLAHGFKKSTLSGPGETLEMPIGGLMYEDAGAAILDYGDKLVTFDITGWESHPWVEAWRIEIYGTDGTLEMGIQPPWQRLYIRNAKPGYQPGYHLWEGFRTTGTTNSLVVDENYVGEILHMVRRVREWDTDNSRWIAEAKGVIEILDAIFRSQQQQDAILLEPRHANV